MRARPGHPGSLAGRPGPGRLGGHPGAPRRRPAEEAGRLGPRAHRLGSEHDRCSTREGRASRPGRRVLRRNHRPAAGPAPALPVPAPAGHGRRCGALLPAPGHPHRGGIGARRRLAGRRAARGGRARPCSSGGSIPCRWWRPWRCSRWPSRCCTLGAPTSPPGSGFRCTPWPWSARRRFALVGPGRGHRAAGAPVLPAGGWSAGRPAAGHGGQHAGELPAHHQHRGRRSASPSPTSSPPASASRSGSGASMSTRSPPGPRGPRSWARSRNGTGSPGKCTTSWRTR